MTVIALFSDKGSPGVTTLGLALATVWPRPAVPIELDPAGGDLALRLTDHTGRPLLAPEPSLLTLAAAARRDPAVALLDHTHRSTSGAFVVPGLATPQQAQGMASLWPKLTAALRAESRVDVIADLGRLTPESPAADLAAQADVLVGVVRAEPAAMLRLRDRLGDVLGRLPANAARRALVVLVAEDRRASEAIAAMDRVLAGGAIRAQVAGVAATDPHGVRALCAGQRRDRSVLLRSVRDLAAALLDVPAAPAPVPGPRRIPVWSR